MFKRAVEDLCNYWSKMVSVIPPKPIRKLIRAWCSSFQMDQEISYWVFVNSRSMSSFGYLQRLWRYVHIISIDRLEVWINIVRANDHANWSWVGFPARNSIGCIPPTFRAFMMYFIFLINSIQIFLINSITSIRVEESIEDLSCMKPSVLHQESS